jgi:hypothetical protein
MGFCRRCFEAMACSLLSPDIVLSLLVERFSQLRLEEILMIDGLPLQELRHSRAVHPIPAPECRCTGGPAGGLVLVALPRPSATPSHLLI